MNDNIVCPNCKSTIPLTDALSHRLQEKYQKFYKIRLEEEKVKIEQSIKEEMSLKIKKEMELELHDKANEAKELSDQNTSLKTQLLDLNKLIRQLRSENDIKRVEMEKKMSDEQQRIRLEEKRRIDEEYKLKIFEKDKKLSDALVMVEEYKRKLEQGSQQLQGELLELKVEEILKREFFQDEINEVPKGITGADVIQVVKSDLGRICGTIVWELKRTRAWSDSWITKLKEDQRSVKADIAVIVSETLPDNISRFGLKEGVWVCGLDSIIGLATAIRMNLLNIATVKLSTAGKTEKKEILWSYLTGVEFRGRVDAIFEAYTHLQSDIEVEKRWFAKKWAKQEKNIRMVIDNILGMHGDLQAIVGKVLPEMKKVENLQDGL